MSLLIGTRRALLAPSKGGGSGLTPPPGFVFLIDSDGAYLLDSDGAYLMEPA